MATALEGLKVEGCMERNRREPDLFPANKQSKLSGSLGSFSFLSPSGTGIGFLSVSLTRFVVSV